MRELTCIGCPLGCSLRVFEENGQLRVEGNTCPRGEAYAKNEVLCPKRTVTSTVAIHGGTVNRLSVRTQTDIPKDKIFACMEQIKAVSVEAPAAIGDVILPDVAGTGVALIATKDVKKK
ncbi:MAG: DUF1667 domain-containing protein [Oscillospiraceae bacterium]|nr:DUF1667 domain-containing protein [Oscillospiraceae bacterium]